MMRHAHIAHDGRPDTRPNPKRGKRYKSDRVRESKQAHVIITYLYIYKVLVWWSGKNLVDGLSVKFGLLEIKGLEGHDSLLFCELLKVGQFEVAGHLSPVHLGVVDRLLHHRFLAVTDLERVHGGLRRRILKCRYRQTALLWIHHRLMIGVLEPPVTQILHIFNANQTMY